MLGAVCMWCLCNWQGYDFVLKAFAETGGAWWLSSISVCHLKAWKTSLLLFRLLFYSVTIPNEGVHVWVCVCLCVFLFLWIPSNLASVTGTEDFTFSQFPGDGTSEARKSHLSSKPPGHNVHLGGTLESRVEFIMPSWSWHSSLEILIVRIRTRVLKTGAMPS